MVIANRGYTFVALDTSALSNVIQDMSSVERFAETILRRHTIVLIPKLVLFEFSSNADVQKVFAQLQRLQHLCRVLGTRFCPSLDHEDLMHAETEGWLRAPPVYERGWRTLADAPASELRQLATQLPPSAEWLRKKKADLFETDRSLHRFVAENRLPPQPDIVV